MLGEMLDACQYFSKRVSFAGTGDGRVLRKCQAVMPPPGQRVPRSSFGLTRSEINSSRLFGDSRVIASPRKKRPLNAGLRAGAAVWDAAAVSA
jgi:hypothetical protein